MIDVQQDFRNICLPKTWKHNGSKMCIRDRYQAASIILAHNHPGGLALPSHDDMQTTRRIRDMLLPLSIGLRDHIIVAGDDFVSMRDSKLMQYLDP